MQSFCRIVSLLLLLSISCVSRAGEPTGKDYAQFLSHEDEQTVIVSGSNRGLGLGWVKH